MNGVINPDTGKPMKHYAQDLVTRARYIVIALQNDNDPDTCSVIDIDALDADLRAELVAFVNSDACQRVPEIWKLLDTKYFMSYSSATMLKVLKSLRQIKVVKSAQVGIQLPDGQVKNPKEVIAALNEYYSKMKSKNGQEHFSPYAPTAALPSAPAAQATVAPTVDKGEIDALKEEIGTIKETVSSLTSSISDLVKALAESTTPAKGKKA